MTAIGISFQVTGEPVPKQSTRFADKGAYLDPRVGAWQHAVSLFALQAVALVPGRFEMLEGDVQVSLMFTLPDRRRRDLDNLSKAVLDAMIGIVYEDDTQVVDLRIRKKIDAQAPGVFVTVLPVGE